MDTSHGIEAPQAITFDTQFSDKKTLENPAGNMKYVEIQSVFESPTDKTPLLVFPGWSITLATEKPLLRTLTSGVEEKRDETGAVVGKAYYGRNVVACEFPRFGGSVISPDNIPDELMRQAELISALTMNQEGMVDISADSMAAASLLIATKIHPEILDKLRNIMDLSPAGLSGAGDNFLRLVGRSLVHFGQDTGTFLKSPIERRNIIRMGLEMALYVGKNAKRTIGEVNAIAKADEYGELKKLQSEFEAKGIMFGVMQARDDKLMPAAKLWSNIGEGYPMQVVPSVTTPSKYAFKPHNFEMPPIDITTEVAGGHDNRLYAEPDFGIKILRGFEELNKMRENAGNYPRIG